MGRLRGDLAERTLQFSVQVVNIADTLPNKMQGWILGKQLLRSGTSIGSNVREADNALTDAEFAHKCGIARRRHRRRGTGWSCAGVFGCLTGRPWQVCCRKRTN